MTISNIKIWFNKAVAGVGLVAALPHLFIVATAGYLLEIYVLKLFDWNAHLLWLYVVGSILLCNRIESIKAKIPADDDVYKTGLGKDLGGMHRVFSFTVLLIMSVGIVITIFEHKPLILAAQFVCLIMLIWLVATWVYFYNLLILKMNRDEGDGNDCV